MEIGCRFGRDEEFDCKDKMKKSAMQKPASENPDIIGKLILGKELLQKMNFLLALYQIWGIYLQEKPKKANQLSV